MDNRFVTYNVMPSPTWNRLRLNGERRELSAPRQTVSPVAEGFAPIPAEQPNFPLSAGEDFSRWLDDQNIPIFGFLAERDEANLRVTLETPGDAARLFVRVPDGMRVNLITTQTAASCLELAVEAGADSLVRLVQVFDGGAGEPSSSFGARLAKNARIEVHQIVLSGSYTALGGHVTLSGEESSAAVRIAYRAKGEDEIDVNWVVTQQGKHTDSVIRADGVLDDRAKKRFRGTIDFLRGASASTGAENEDVLLLSPQVENKTLPIILCREEDVSGTHGASIGRLSDELLFAFAARGMDEATARRIMSHARLASAAAAIPDEATRTHILSLLDEEDA